MRLARLTLQLIPRSNQKKEIEWEIKSRYMQADERWKEAITVAEAAKLELVKSASYQRRQEAEAANEAVNDAEKATFELREEIAKEAGSHPLFLPKGEWEINPDQLVRQPVAQYA